MTYDEAYEFQVTVPAGTPVTAPVVVPTAFPLREVGEIRWRVPRGSAGKMGWRVSMGGVPVIPRNAGGWVIADGHAAAWPLAGQPTSGAWDITAYNTGAQPHTIHVTFMAKVIRPAPKVMQYALNSDLSNYGDMPAESYG